jgi:thioredoxin-related protein
MHMKNLFRYSLLAIALVFATSTVFGLRWERSISSALKKSKQLKKPVLLVFSNPKKDAKCKKFETTIMGSHEFKAYAGQNLIAVRYDVGKLMGKKAKLQVKKMIEHYGIKKYPSALILDSSNKKLGTLRIGEDPEEFVTMMKSIASRYKAKEKKNKEVASL